MEIELLIQSIMGLVAVLGVLIFLLLYAPAAQEKKPKKVTKSTPKSTSKYSSAESDNIKTDLDSLRAIIKSKKSTSKELKSALDLVLKHHGHIHKKLGVRVHPDFDVYMDILFSICRHPNTNKNIIINFDKELERLNPEYKAEINDAITKGLNSRGA